MPLYPNIAIIDSGINVEHPHVQKVIGGHGVAMNTRGKIKQTTDFRDCIGHGTAITGIICKYAPFAGMYGIRIFQQELRASALVFVESLKWAIRQNFKIIHLSLGIEHGKHTEELQALCQKAYNQGIIVIAAARLPEDSLLPAALDTVIGVYWHRACSVQQLIYHPQKPVEFGAHGWPRPIPGIPPEVNFRGHSFAAAHLTAKAAQLVKAGPVINTDSLKEALIAISNIADIHKDQI